MVKEELYKLELKFLKILPVSILIFYIIFMVFSVFNINISFISYLGSLSIIPALFILLTSKVFRFCITHRLPIYYIIVVDITNYVLSVCSVGVLIYVSILSIISTIFIILTCIFKHRENVKNHKKSSS